MAKRGTDGLHRQYTIEMLRDLGLRATWPPDDDMELGAVGFLEPRLSTQLDRGIGRGFGVALSSGMEVCLVAMPS